MKAFRHTILAAMIAGVSLFTGSADAQDLKIGIVDMTRVFAEYYKTKDAENQVNDGKAMAKKELDERNVRYKELIEKYSELVAAIKDPGISEELRATKQKEAQDVAAEARSLEREKQEFAERRQRQLLEQVDRMRKAIVEEIQELVGQMSKEGNYDLVFDKSGLGTRGIPFLLHSKDAVDFSEDVITKLNANAPATPAAPASPE
jgi:outer membrane protein